MDPFTWLVTGHARPDSALCIFGLSTRAGRRSACWRPAGRSNVKPNQRPPVH